MNVNQVVDLIMIYLWYFTDLINLRYMIVFIRSSSHSLNATKPRPDLLVRPN